MQINFLWIENFRKVKRQGLNFNAQFNFNYDPKSNSLSVTENPDYISDFYGKSIKSLTAIVGENGTGKTSILDFIKDKLGNERPIRNKIIIVYAPDNAKNCKVVINNTDPDFRIESSVPKSKLKLDIIYLKDNTSLFGSNFDRVIGAKTTVSYDIKTSALGSPRVSFKNKLPSLLELVPGFENSIILFYSNIFDYRLENSSSFVYNLSTNFLESSQGNKIRISEIKSQVEFVIRSSNVEKLEISLPDLITIKFKIKQSRPYSNPISNIDPVAQRNFGHFKTAYYIDHLINRLEDNVKLSRNFKANGLRVCVSLLHNYLTELYSVGKSDWLKPLLLSFASAIHRNSIVTVDLIKDIIDQIRSAGNKFDFDEDRSLIKVNNELVSNLKKIFDYIIEFNLIYIAKANVFSVDLPVSGDNAFATKDFIESYVRSFIERSPVEIDWQDMSSGEKARLAFLSRLHSLRTDKLFKQHGKHKDIILLIDEGEQYFHPQWQKEYISFLVTNLPVLFPDIQFQIILTSHSPFVLSDLFRENVIYLARSPKTKNTTVIQSSTKERTLAANIHTLFTDAYFMKDGLMGSFVQNKMQEVLAPLVKNTMTKEQSKTIIKFINAIGEPLLRNRLVAMFNSYNKEQ